MHHDKTIDLNYSYKLIRENRDWKTWNEFVEGDYQFYEYNNNLCGIHFRCPGCGQVIAIDVGYETDKPKWKIDFGTLTASPSILHMKDSNGCGWHGYMTNGELKPC